MTTEHRYTLTLSCPDRVGIVATVSQFFATHGGWIVETHNHADAASGRFFVRIEVRADSLPCDIDTLRDRFAEAVEGFAMDWHIHDSKRRKRTVILVSKQSHCLYDLLGRWTSGELDMDIPCVISNHDDLRGLVEWHGIPFHHIPVSPDTKTTAYAEIGRIFDAVAGDVMVLARYMQILDAALCERLPGRILNIHHSFLPSFVGARPYHQAFERGVKLIGATCHYVTTDLDEGPIIDQDVIRIDHTDTAEDLAHYGKDIEKMVLARGLRHIENRVMLQGNKTIVFR